MLWALIVLALDILVIWAIATAGGQAAVGRWRPAGTIERRTVMGCLFALLAGLFDIVHWAAGASRRSQFPGRQSTV
jgi:hypothetical protein